MPSDFEEFTDDLQALGIEGLRNAAQLAARINRRWLAIANEKSPRPVSRVPDTIEALSQCVAIELVRASMLASNEPATPTPVDSESPTASLVEPQETYCDTCKNTFASLEAFGEHRCSPIQ